MKVTLSTGKVDYQFDTPHTVKPTRLPAADVRGWPQRMLSSPNLTIGSFEGGNTIKYEEAP
jgi:hypothetical protein